MKEYPNSLTDLPNEPYLAILETSSIYIEGDERSKTNPGHGYPAHTVTSWSMSLYDSKDEWTKQIELLTERNKQFQAVKIVPAKVETTVEIKIKEQ